jgi:hypothetical protein
MTELPTDVEELQRLLIESDRARLSWHRLFAQALFMLGGTDRALSLTQQLLTNWCDDDWTVQRFDHPGHGGLVQFALRARERPKGETVCPTCRGKKYIRLAGMGQKPCPKCGDK